MESHHEGKGRIDEADTFVECAGVRKDKVGSGGETFAEQRYNRGVLCARASFGARVGRGSCEGCRPKGIVERAVGGGWWQR